MLLFLVAWLGGWVFGEVSAARELVNPRDGTPSAFLAFWLAGWTLGGAFCLGTVFWQLAGREVLVVSAASPHPFTNQRAWFPPLAGSGYGYGPIAFDYGARTIRVGPGLEEAEARMLVRELAPRLPGARLET